MKRLSPQLVAHVYSVVESISLPVRKSVVRELNEIVTIEIAAGRNTVPLTNGERQIKFVYLDAPSMMYFIHSTDDNTISQEAPYLMLDLPSQYDVAIDIGAHFGVYSVLLRSLNEIDLLCFEPDDGNRRIRGMNLIHNDTEGTVDDRVVVGTAGRVTFYEGDSAVSNDHTIRSVDDATYTPATKGGTTISAVIDGTNAHAVFAKIDAEGKEDEIAADLVSCDVEILSGLVELHPDLLHSGPNDVLERLTDAGFHVEPAPSIGNPIYRFANDAARAIERNPSRQCEHARTEERK